MSDAREWLTDVYAANEADRLAGLPTVVEMTTRALLAVLDECDELEFGDESGAYPGIWYDALALASGRILAAIDKALGVTDE